MKNVLFRVEVLKRYGSVYAGFHCIVLNCVTGLTCFNTNVNHGVH